MYKRQGLERDLPICPLNDNLSIAGFVMFGDVEMTIRSAEELLKRVGDFDLLITAESKGIPLAYEMSRQSGKKYILARKSIKLYMQDVYKRQITSPLRAFRWTTILRSRCPDRNPLPGT